MIRLFFGPDTFTRSEAVKQLKRELDSDGMVESNTTVLDGATISPDELRNHCNTVPFLASKRLVVVEGLIRRTERRRRTAPDERDDGECEEASSCPANG